MSKFIFVTGSYDPHPRANAVCARAIEDDLKNRGHEVIYVVTRHDVTQQTQERINGNRVFFIPRPIHELHWSIARVKDAFVQSAIEKQILIAAHFLLKVLFKVTAFLSGKNSRMRTQDIYRKNFLSVMSNLLLEERPDGVLTFSVPFSSHLLTLESFKKSGQRPYWASVLFDPHKYSDSRTEEQYSLFGKEETSVFKEVDRAFLLNVLASDYDKPEYDAYRERFSYFRLPFFKIPIDVPINRSHGITKKANWIDLTFAGTLYDTARSADYLCRFMQSCQGKNIRFHLLGKFYPNTLQKLLETVEKMPEQVFVYEFMDRESALAHLASSDVLMNIGNDNVNQVPSKILEYMGMLKPILSFIRDSDDAGLEYLTKYPYSLVIDERSSAPIKEVVDNAVRFFRDCKEHVFSVEEIRRRFKGYLQEDVTGEIIDTIEKDISEFTTRH
ncbi:glycosyltransferase [bacterium]|nr:glycosyltransferase [bacterium]